MIREKQNRRPVDLRVAFGCCGAICKKVNAVAFDATSLSGHYDWKHQVLGII